MVERWLGPELIPRWSVCRFGKPPTVVRRSPDARASVIARHRADARHCGRGSAGGVVIRTQRADRRARPRRALRAGVAARTPPRRTAPAGLRTAHAVLR